MPSFNRSRMFFDCCTKDCPDRVPGCHGSRKKYKDKRAEFDEKKAAEDLRNEVNVYISDRRRKRLDAGLKRKRRFAGSYITEG